MTDRTAFRSCVLAFALDRAPRPLDLIVVSALFFLFGGGLWVVSGHEFQPVDRNADALFVERDVGGRSRYHFQAHL